MVCHKLCKNPTVARKLQITNLFHTQLNSKSWCRPRLISHVYLVAVKKWSTKGILFYGQLRINKLNYFTVKETSSLRLQHHITRYAAAYICVHLTLN